jgi:serine/threonine-protein kinase
MSPEQATGDRPLDGRTDVYSVGCVLYEMLVGDPPHVASTAQAILSKILMEEPKSISQVRRSVPAHVSAAVDAALEKLPADRIPSAADFARSLADESFSTGPAAIQPPRRSQRIVLALLASIALVTSGGLIGWLLHPHGTPALPFHTTLSPPDESEFSWVQFAVSPDGTRAAFVAISPDGDRSIWIWDFRSGESTRFAGTEDAQFPFWSPDSRSIAFFTEGELKKLEIGIGAPTVLWEGYGVDMWTPGGTWNEDGTILFGVAGTDGGLFRVTEGNEVTRVTSLDQSVGETSHRHPLFLPDGSHFLYVARRRDPTKSMLYIGALDSPDRRVLFNSDFNVEWTSTGHLVFQYGGTLMARQFDLDSFELGADAFPLGQSVRYNESNGSAGFSISRNGVLVYRTGGVVSEAVRPLDIVSKEGAHRLTIAEDLESPDEVRVSPNGRRGVVRTEAPGEDQLSVFELEGHALVPLVSGGRHPVWLNDSRVAFTSTVAVTDGQLMVIPTDGSILQPVSLGGLEPFLGIPLTVSPDGRQLLVSVRDSTTGGDIWVITLDGETPPRTWLGTEHDEGAARSSPDGRWVAFESDRGGQRHVWVTSWTDPGYTTRVSIEPDSREPVWSLEDEELYFRTLAQMLVARYSTDLEIRFEPPAQLFTRTRGFVSGYDVLPGGGFISSRMLDEEPDPELHVVQNWFQWLSAREGGR